MPVSIPFLVSETHYKLNCTIDDKLYVFRPRWNSRDEGWYFDMYEADDVPVIINVKIVTGVPLGRRSHHVFFDSHIITAVDTSGQGLDPGFDDLNRRVVVVVQTPSDLA